MKNRSLTSKRLFFVWIAAAFVLSWVSAAQASKDELVQTVTFLAE